MVKLEQREYQERAVIDTMALLIKDRRVLMVAPGGSGKTVIGSLIISRTKRYRRVLWLAHRAELIDQARTKLINLGVPCGVQCAKHEQLYPGHVDLDARVQIGSVQTIYRRRRLPKDIDLIVFDEAHRAMADTYRKIAAMCPRAAILGLTATPCRLDGRGLGRFFRTMKVVTQPSELYERDHLSNPITYHASRGVLKALAKGLRGAKTRGGDYTAASLRRAVDRPMLIGHVIEESIKRAPDVSKVVFAATRDHSKRIAARFVKVGIKAVHLDGTTPAAERRRILNDLRNGTLEVVCNVDVLCEGWDLPELGAVIIARPTKSLSRLMQMVARAQRKVRKKKRLRKIVLDHGANCERHQYIPGEDWKWTLSHGAGKPIDAASEPRTKICANDECRASIAWACDKCPHCNANQPSTKTRRQILEERDAKLVKLNRARFEKAREALRARAKKVAYAKGLDVVWIERVVDGESTKILARQARQAWRKKHT
jgi:DNA repair protein RadD